VSHLTIFNTQSLLCTEILYLTLAKHFNFCAKYYTMELVVELLWRS